MKNNKHWNRCDICGQFISFNAFDCGNAVRRMTTPDSNYSTEDYETLCEKHREVNSNLPDTNQPPTQN